MERYYVQIKYTLLILVYLLFSALFWPFHQPIFFAALFAIALTPVVKKQKHRFKNENRMVLSMLVAILLFFFLPLTLIVTSAIMRLKKIKMEEISQLPLFAGVDRMLDSVTGFMNNLSDSVGVDIVSQINLKGIFAQVAQSVFNFLTTLVTESPTFILNFIIFIIALYYMLMRRQLIAGFFKDLHLLTTNQIDKLVDVLQNTCYTVLVSSVFVAAIQAAIIAIACSVAGYNEFLIVFLITFFTSFFPVVGSAPVPVVLGAYSLLNGQYGAALILIVALVISGSIDNILRTYFLGGDDEVVHPMVSLISLIGAIALFNIAGLFIGPIVAELAYRIKPILFPSEDCAI